MSLIRKYAAPIALLAALMMMAAAPYLIPENPDSAAFRSGTLGAILILTSAYPVFQAYRHASRRTLTCGLAVGLLFSFALSLGSELLIYNGLLRGLGSLLRRLAVPVLAAPLLGGLCARLLTARLPRKKVVAQRIPLWAFALILFLFWLPLLLAFYPGMLNYDFASEYAQHVEQAYSSIHPLLHSALVNGVITLGELLVSRTFGVLLMSLLQMALFALALAYALAFMQRHGAPLWILLLATAFFALHPVFSVMSVSMTKDTLFAAAVTVFSLMTWTLIESPDAFWANKRRCALYVAMGVCTALLRNNGVFALLLACPALLLVLRGHRKRAALLLACCGTACAATLGALTLALSPEAMPSFQLYSLPAQQLVRAYNLGTMSDADKAELESWYTSEMGLRVIPHLGDSAKGYLDRPRIQAEGGDFLKLWAKNAGANATEYLEAFLMLNVGSWYPDDLSHSTIYPDASWNDKGYLQLNEYDLSQYDLHTTSYLPAVRDLYERICRRNVYQKYPILPILFCTATPFFAIVLACASLIARRQGRFLPAALGALGLWISYLFGPCTLPRYTLPLFCLAPALLAAAFGADDGFTHTSASTAHAAGEELLK